MKKFTLSLILASTLLLSGCSTLKDLWQDHKGAILDKVVKVLEEEKVERKVIDKIIKRLKSEVATVDSSTVANVDSR